MLIDTHCHLDFPDFDLDRATVIERAKQEGVGCMINIGSSLRGSQAGVDLARQYDFIYASIGIHPHEADKTLPITGIGRSIPVDKTLPLKGIGRSIPVDKIDQEIIRGIEQLSKEPKVVAIGEIGLDYYRGISSVKGQKQLFTTLLDLAKSQSLPVIIHCRQAQEDTFKILKEKKITCGVVHCFSGDEVFLRQCLDLNLHVSFTCNLTYKKAQRLRNLARLVPLERLLLETDAPFLPPEGLRGRRNESGYLKYLAEKLAQIKGVDKDEIARVTTANAKALFKLNIPDS